MKPVPLILLLASLTASVSCGARGNRIGRAELYWLMNRACWTGDDLAVEMLLKAGADPDGVGHYDAFHKSRYQYGVEPSWPINQAAWGGHVKVVQRLLQAGAKAHAPEGEGQTALTTAAERGHKEVVRLLLEAGADTAYRAPYARGRIGTAEEIARNSGQEEIADFIWQFKGKSSALAATTQALRVGGATCPDTLPSTGRYVNDSYGFTVVIPKSRKGFWNSAACVPEPDGCTCMSDHGRIIPLSAEPFERERHIEVYAGNATHLDEPTVQQKVDKNLDSIRERSRVDSVTVLKQSNLLLAGLKARRMVIRYFDSRLNTWMIEDFVGALRGGEIEYSVYLRTREEVYKEDVPVLDSVINRFRLKKRR